MVPWQSTVNMKKGAKFASALLVVAAILAIAHLFPLTRWVLSFVEWVRGLGIPGALVYGLAYIAGTVLLLPGTALTLGSGFLYGPLFGVLLVSPASVLGATISFLLARSFAREWARRRIGQHPKVEIIDRAIEKHGFKVVFLLRLEPLIAFVLLNYALGLTRVRLRDYILASWLGMLPATFLYVYLGSSMKSVTDLVGGKPIPSFWHEILLWGGLAAVAILVYVLTRIARDAVQKELALSAEHKGEKV